MIEIKKVNSADFKKVFPLLKRFNETKISKSDWEKIFENRCQNTPNYAKTHLK